MDIVSELYCRLKGNPTAHKAAKEIETLRQQFTTERTALEQERLISHTLEKALKLCKFDSLNMRLDDMKFISATIAEVAAIRAKL